MNHGSFRPSSVLRPPSPREAQREGTRITRSLCLRFCVGSGDPRTSPRVIVQDKTEAITATSTISDDRQPRDKSMQGLAKPWIKGPKAVAPANRSAIL